MSKSAMERLQTIINGALEEERNEILGEINRLEELYKNKQIDFEDFVEELSAFIEEGGNIKQNKAA